jgi:hypothetical protein
LHRSNSGIASFCSWAISVGFRVGLKISNFKDGSVSIAKNQESYVLTQYLPQDKLNEKEKEISELRALEAQTRFKSLWINEDNWLPSDLFVFFHRDLASFFEHLHTDFTKINKSLHSSANILENWREVSRIMSVQDQTICSAPV